MPEMVISSAQEQEVYTVLNRELANLASPPCYYNLQLLPDVSSDFSLFCRLETRGLKPPQITTETDYREKFTCIELANLRHADHLSTLQDRALRAGRKVQL